MNSIGERGMGNKVTLYAVGDIGIHKDGPGQEFESTLRYSASTATC